MNMIILLTFVCCIYAGFIFLGFDGALSDMIISTLLFNTALLR